MRYVSLALTAMMVAINAGAADQAVPATAIQDARHGLLEHLTGHWVMRGTISGKPTTHDVDAQWVLDKEYVQIHEISREKKPDGKPQYEAIIYVVWNHHSQEYACVWMDTTDVASFPPEGVGHAEPAGDRMTFLFKDSDGGIHTTFTYDHAKDGWTWDIDNEAKGTLTPFARLTLTRQ
jgi:hypothetical protein